MYLEAKIYVKNWEHTTPENRTKITIKKDGKDFPNLNPDLISNLIIEIGYWRKANAIHKWFVENVQDGNDDCKDAYVSEEKLQELSKTIDKVLKASKLIKGKIQNGTTYKDGKLIPIMEDGKYIKDSTIAQKLLPTKEGFFFGSTDYNEFYINDLKKTKIILKDAIKYIKNGASIYYSSNW